MMTVSAFHQATGRYPSEAVALLDHLKTQQGRLDPDQVQDLMAVLQLSRFDLLKALLPLAAALSSHPISHFAVGAIVEGYIKGEDGPLYFGANLELPGQPLKMTVHAEQAAVCNAWHQGESRIRRLIVNEAPCGHCRQFLNELNGVEQTEIIVSRLGSHKEHRYALADLLPNAFGPQDLDQKDRLLATSPVTITLPPSCAEDQLAQAAAEAAANSYAPCCGCYSGLALRLTDGRIITGRYGANAAFNPGITALESAMVNWRLANLNTLATGLADAVLVECNQNISHQKLTAMALAEYGISLRYIAVQPQ